MQTEPQNSYPVIDSPPKGRPEIDLLILCARTNTDTPITRRIRETACKQIEWDYLFNEAHENGVLPLLSQNLNEICPDILPREILQRLQENIEYRARKNFFIVGELFKIAKLLETHGVSAIPYKGPALAVEAYGDLNLRMFRDVDFFIDAKARLQARDILAAEGYQLQLTKAQQMLKFLHHYHDHFSGPVHAEIHWAFSEGYWRFRFSQLPLWERLQSINLAGGRVNSFHPEDLLIILCVHGAKHLWSRLIWICDVAELVQSHTGMNWQRIIIQAQKVGCKRILLLNLLLAKEVLALALPEEILQAMQKDRFIEPLAAQIQTLLFNRNHSDLTSKKKALLYYKMRERLRDKLPLVFYDLNPVEKNDDGTHKEGYLIPPSLSFMYYVLRPYRLLLKGLKNPLRAVRLLRQL